MKKIPRPSHLKDRHVREAVALRENLRKRRLAVQETRKPNEK